MESEKVLEQLVKLPPLPLGHTKTYDEYMAAHELPPATDSVDPKGLVGIEVEIENIRKIAPDLTIGFWGIKEDGSLRNDGREFVTNALPSVYAKPALQALFLGLNKNIDFSRRTSIHVHANMRTLTPSQILALLYIYHTIEPLFFKFVGGNRNNNIFCVPWANSGSLEIAATKDGFMSRIKNLRENSHKYSALNLVPLTKFGTLEFRHMPGTSDVAKISNWVNMILSLKIYAVKHPIERIIETISALNTNSHYIDFLTTVFGPLHANLDTSEILKDMEPGVTDIKEAVSKMLYHTKFMSDWYENGTHPESRAAKLYSKLNAGKVFKSSPKVNIKALYAEEGGAEAEDEPAPRFRRIRSMGRGAAVPDGEPNEDTDLRKHGEIKIYSQNNQLGNGADFDFPQNPIETYPADAEIARERADGSVWLALNKDADYNYEFPKYVYDNSRGNWVYFSPIIRRWGGDSRRIQQWDSRRGMWIRYVVR